jgi:hypothetical protein
LEGTKIPWKRKGQKKRQNFHQRKRQNNANWDFNYSVIPKFETVPGIVLFAFDGIMSPNLQYAVKPTRPFEKSQNPGSPIHMIGIAQIRMRPNTKPTIGASLVQEYYKAYSAKYSVNISIENYLVIDEPTK